MEDPDTQDILAVVRDADAVGESENVFFLYVATPRRPPSALHRKVIEPFLRSKGWKKVSYRNTGFRALYFLRRNSFGEKNNTTGKYSTSHNISDTSNDGVIVISSDDDSDRSDFEEGPSSSFRTRNTQSRTSQNRTNRSQNSQPVSSSNDDDDESILLNATQRATNHRTELKRKIEEYKAEKNLDFHVHIVLSRPIDYEEDFAELESQPGSVEP